MESSTRTPRDRIDEHPPTRAYPGQDPSVVSDHRPLPANADVSRAYPSVRQVLLTCPRRLVRFECLCIGGSVSRGFENAGATFRACVQHLDHSLQNRAITPEPAHGPAIGDDDEKLDHLPSSLAAFTTASMSTGVIPYFIYVAERRLLLMSAFGHTELAA